MTYIFGDAKGATVLDYYLPRGTSLNSQYCCKLLGQLRYNIRNRRRGSLNKGLFFQKDSASPHTGGVTEATLDRSLLLKIPHLPQSPALNPGDFYPFRHQKKHLRGNRCGDNYKLFAAMQDWAYSITKSFFFEGILGLQGRCENCILVQLDYVKK